MSGRLSTSLRIIRQVAEIFGATASASPAVRNHRRPSDRALKALGIDPERFPDA